MCFFTTWEVAYCSVICPLFLEFLADQECVVFHEREKPPFFANQEIALGLWFCRRLSELGRSLVIDRNIFDSTKFTHRSRKVQFFDDSLIHLATCRQASQSLRLRLGWCWLQNFVLLFQIFMWTLRDATGALLTSKSQSHKQTIINKLSCFRRQQQ